MPIRVALLDEPDLPFALPCLERLFARYGQQDIIMGFDENEAHQAISFAKGRT